MRPEDQTTPTRRFEGSQVPQPAVLSDPDNAEVTSLRVGIERTRNDMTGTVEAIERQLNPQQLTDQAKETAKELTDQAKETAKEITEQAKEAAKDITDHAIGEAKEAIQTLASQASASVRAATIGKVENVMQQTGERMNEAQSSIIDIVKQNPMASALVGLGLSWLFMSRGGNTPKRSSSFAPRYYPTRQSTLQGGGYGSGNWSEKESRFDEGQNAIHGVIDRAQETAGEVVDQVQEVASSARGTATDLGTGLLDVVRQNPVPAALAGLSIGYLLMNSSGATESPPVYRARGEAKHAAGQVRDTTERAAGQVRDTTERVAGQVRDTTERVAGDVQDTAEEVVDRVQSTADHLTGQVQQKAERFGDDLDYQALRTKMRFQEILNENPLAIGAAAFLLGAAIGLPVPQTQQESNLMGSASNQVVDRAKSVAQDTIQRVQNVAEETQNTVEREAKKEGLAS